LIISETICCGSYQALSPIRDVNIAGWEQLHLPCGFYMKIGSSTFITSRGNTPDIYYTGQHPFTLAPTYTEQLKSHIMHLPSLISAALLVLAQGVAAAPSERSLTLVRKEW